MASRSESAQLVGHYDRLHNGRAVIRLVDDQEIIVPLRFLPPGTLPGQPLVLHIHTPETANRQHQDLARAVLKEILNG